MSTIQVGDYVLVKNYKKHTKFDPEFMTDLFIVSALSKRNIVTIQNLENGCYLKRHPNDLNIFKGSHVNNKRSTELVGHTD